jgi:hypothetical protein
LLARLNSDFHGRINGLVEIDWLGMLFLLWRRLHYVCRLAYLL